MDFPNPLNGLQPSVPNTVGNRSARHRAGEEMRLKAAQSRFLACFRVTCSATRSARAAKVNRGEHYRWLKNDPTYLARFREAMQDGLRTLEDHAVKLAFEGVKRLVTFKGKPVRDPVTGGWLYETEFDSQVLMFLLKNYDRKRFGDKIDTTFGPNWSGNLEDLPEEFLRQVLQQIEAQGAALKAKQIEAGTPAAAQTVDVKAEPSAGEFPKNGV